MKLRKVTGDLTLAKGTEWYARTVVDARVNHSKLFFAFDVKGGRLQEFCALLDQAGWPYSVESGEMHLPRCVTVKWTGPVGLAAEALMRAQREEGATPVLHAQLDGNLPRDDSSAGAKEKLAVLSFPGAWCEGADSLDRGDDRRAHSP